MDEFNKLCRLLRYLIYAFIACMIFVMLTPFLMALLGVLA